ncbi:hydroxysqualene dehydroxylase HpnE [Bordetella sp. 02P26C-1]|uniref:hydroxysqualene dehydroxylase HpnE n=1 Tax=Bordetella sp. 02P26C-1 TaxID=2683195 RepID=UPI001354EB64|nr:hydroxysqualene dehydroxylase HpnE [Bordetella sp. 02P26C-1]MVW80295.1 FAD-dependent oxidoreductase [Bordetella sp. 02P26C-1]
MKKVAIIGAGWAGLAACAALRDAGAQVTVFEAGRTPGGRARRVVHPDFGGHLDNGQHILLGAYQQTLALMRRLGRNPATLLMRRSLRLSSLDGAFNLAAPALPAPFHALAALVTARGLSWESRLAAIRLMRGLQKQGWRPPRDWTVSRLLSHYQQPAQIVQRLWEPLCLAALNTPLDEASAGLFARILQDSLTGDRRNSDLLLPCVDLSALWPDAVALHATMRYGATVRHLKPGDYWVDVNRERFDAAVLAVPPFVAARLLEDALLDADSPGLLHALQAFEYVPIATLNLRLAAPWPLPAPMMLLREDKSRGHWGQWVFDRSRLTGRSPESELAIVTSAARALSSESRETIIANLTQQVTEQAARHPSRLPPMPAVVAAELFVEKRATFAAVPGLNRPLNSTPWPTLALAGDWTDTGYPGVLEGAVRSGLKAAQVLLAGK